jgi:MFS family permease
MSQDLTGGRQIAIACVIACAFLMQGIDTTLLTIAIPTIAPDLGVSSLMMHFAVTAYLLGLAVFMPVSGWFADRFGTRRVFAAAITVFVLGSVLAGLSPTLSAMVAARLLQGFGGALMTPVGPAHRAQGLRTGSGARRDDVAHDPGADRPAPRAPDGRDHRHLLRLALDLLRQRPALRADPRADPLADPLRARAGRRALRLGGFALAGLALVLFQLAVEHLGHPLFAGAFGTLFVLGAALAVFQLYRRHARRHPSPALDLRLFRLRPFSRPA